MAIVAVVVADPPTQARERSKRERERREERTETFCPRSAVLTPFSRSTSLCVPFCCHSAPTAAGVEREWEKEERREETSGECKGDN